jgi:hypothetical protein
MRFIWDAAEHFTIAISSSRSGAPGGIAAMRDWLTHHFRAHWAADRTTADDILAEIQWPTSKPPALVTIDDRAICFVGNWPNAQALLGFKTWQQPGHPYGMLDAEQDPRPTPIPVARQNEAAMLADLDHWLDTVANEPASAREP